MTQPRAALITGAGSGLGRVFATALASDGWTIHAIGRTANTLEATIERCEQASQEHGVELSTPHTAHPCDITDPDQVAELFRTIETTTSTPLTLVINNAGTSGPTGRIDTIDIQAFDDCVATNLRGTFLITQAAFAHMAHHGGGRIINNGSIAATAPRPGAATYAATKAAIASLTRSLTLEGRGHNIVATELDIGNARTELLANFTSEEPMFDAEHAGHIIRSVANLPLDVSLDQITLTAAGMPFIGRG